MSEVGALLTAVASLTWPAIVLVVLWNYRKSVSELFESAKHRGFTVEVGGQKLTMGEVSHQQQEFIEDLRKQLLELRSRVEGVPAPGVAAALTAPAPAAQAQVVLWVDDNPKNNSFFIDLLQKRGYRVDLARSTREGLERMDKWAYRLVLSDMGRIEDGQSNPDAGLDLLQEMKRRNIASQFVLFCHIRNVREFKERALSLGARAITSSPTELRAVLDDVTPPLVPE
jgi:CheY-like chemotaxis protein